MDGNIDIGRVGDKLAGVNTSDGVPHLCLLIVVTALNDP